MLVVDESTKRGHWPKAILQKVYPDANGLVKRVRVRTVDAQNLIRDIQKIYLVYKTVKMKSDLINSFYLQAYLILPISVFLISVGY